MNEFIIFGIFIVAIWFCGRWAHIVSAKVPDWLNQDWLNQAETFIAQKDNVMDPNAPPVDLSKISPPPPYKWWTPFRVKKSDHRLSWIPFVGPLFEKNYRGAWSEFWVVTCSLLTVTSLYINNFTQNYSLYFLGGLFFISILQALTNIDYKTQFLPDMLVYPLMWLGLLFSVLYQGFVSPIQSITGVITGFMSLWTLVFFFSLLRKKEGMGGGDLKLLGAIGAWVGPSGALMTAGLASIVAICYFMVLLIFRKPTSKFAFGPSLATAGIIVYLCLPYIAKYSVV